MKGADSGRPPEGLRPRATEAAGTAATPSSTAGAGIESLVEEAVTADALPGELPADPVHPGPPPATRPWLGIVAATCAVLAWALPALIGRALPLSSLTVVLFRGWIGVGFALGVLWGRGGRLTFRGVRLAAVAGVALGFDLMLFFAALKTTTVANATLLSSMTPLLLVFVAPWLFGERLRWPDLLAAAAALVGASMVVLASSDQLGWSLRGDLYAVLCLVSWTVYLAASKSVRGEVGALEFTAGVTLVASAFLTPFALVHDDLTWPEPVHWLLLTAMAVAGWLGHTLMNWSLRHVPLWAGGTATLAVPVMATGLAALLLAEPFAPVQVVGMAVVVVALTAVAVRSPHLLG